MVKVRFEWDPAKDLQNRRKHGVPFSLAQFAFADRKRVIAQDLSHSTGERRYFCFGLVDSEVVTVRFTFRRRVIRIFGAGYWRKGRQIYAQANQIQRRARP